MLTASLYSWYERHSRTLPWRETTNPYFIWLSEIILQQTRVQQGMDYYMRFIDRFPTVEALAEAPEDEVMLLWQGLGYYSRARNLHRAARQVVSEGWSPFPDTFERVLSLPGVGEYTAGAIMSFAYDAPYPAADGNVYRVLSRLFDCDIPFDTTAGKKHFRSLAWQLLDRDHPRLYNSAIMEFGALYCTPTSPDCDHCPLQTQCRAYAVGTVELLPVRKERAPLRDRYLLYEVLLTPDHRTLIHRREERDIWAHLYEFPLSEQPDAESLASFRSSYGAPIREFSCQHVLSHQRLHARFLVVPVAKLPETSANEQPGALFPIDWPSLQDYALSRLTLRFLDDFAM